MNKLLRTTALACAFTFVSFTAMAHSAKEAAEPPSAAVKASYSLPKNDGAQFRKTLHEADEENTQIKQQIAMDHADLYDILTAPQFDDKTFQTKMEDLRKQQDLMKSNRDDAFIAAVKQLTPAERKTLANGLEANSKYMGMGTMHHHKKVASDTGSYASPSAGSAVAQ